MRTVELAQVKANLETYAREAEKSPVIITKNGKPIAALVAVDDFELELALTARNPNFLAIMERSRVREEAEGSISLEEMRRQLGLPEKTPSEQ